MNVDELFKVPKLPLGKRKLSENPSMETLKRLKMDTGASSSRKATVEDVPDEDEEIGSPPPSFAPGNDADYYREEDEEGRFFGSGLSSEQKDILNIFDNAGDGGNFGDDPDALSITSVRRLLLRFERAVNKNQDQRSKYPDDPTKFIDSEADLDSAIKGLLPLAQAPVLAYPELLKSIPLLIGLLSHENADIVIDVVEVIHELTDEDVGNEGMEVDEDEERNPEQALKTLVDGLVENSILELLVDNLSRLNEGEESDRVGVFHIMGIFENILGFNPDLATKLIATTNLLSWLLVRIEGKTHDENRNYAAELLSILLQDNKANRLEFGKRDGVEICLRTLSQFRLRDPVDADETEFMENVFDTLCSSLSEEANKALFIKSEGPDLLVLMMKAKLESRSRAIKTLDYAMSSTAACEAFVEALGLKTLFSALMGKGVPKRQKSAPTPASEDTAHILGIISSLFSNIASDSPSRVRLLAKFVESNYEKVDKLLDIRENAAGRLKATEREVETEREELVAAGEEVGAEEEDLWYIRRLDGGLFTLQTVDYILGWISMEDDGIRAHLLQMLDRKSLSLRDITRTLRIFYDHVDEPEPSPAADAEDRGLTQKQILAALIAALDPDM
ncbi:DUF1716 domain-containing protein [Mycena kentingensis (nom. inval.)]|nr:DUF1716 domain-containing protein [Mycena kentingensis (nom. inval.)]